MANFVATHGGDVFMRGYIYALGGLFRGAVSIANGKIQLNADGSGSLAAGGYSWDEYGVARLRFPNTVQWIDIENVTNATTRVVDVTKGGFLDNVRHNANFGSVGTISHYLPTPTEDLSLVFRAPMIVTRSTYSAIISSLDNVRFMVLDNSNDDQYLNEYAYASKVSFTPFGYSKGEITLTYRYDPLSLQFVWFIETPPSYTASKDVDIDTINIV